MKPTNMTLIDENFLRAQDVLNCQESEYTEGREDYNIVTQMNESCCIYNENEPSLKQILN